MFLLGSIGDSEQSEAKKTEMQKLQKVFQSPRSPDLPHESLQSHVSPTLDKSCTNGIPMNDYYPVLVEKSV